MKFALIIPDGCADEPQPDLAGQTPLEAASVPHMDEIAQRGVVGRADNVPASMPSGSDVATMSLLGYDPLVCHTGRAPLEAAALGIAMGPDDWAIRCNFVTVEHGLMRSFTAGQIPSDVAAGLIALLQAELGSSSLEFHAGVSYRNVVIHRPAAGQAPFDASTLTTPPHDVTDQSVEPFLPRGAGADWLRGLMQRAAPIVAAAPANLERAGRGALPATGIWLWGLGRRPRLEPFAQRFGLAGAMITAVDLLRGMAVLMGFKNIVVPGATGYLDTDYAAKGRHAIDALAETDLVIVHVEATDEASHEGNARAKVQALEQIDWHIVGPLHRALQAMGPYRILVSPDHPTLLRTKTHSHGFVPFAACGQEIVSSGAGAYSEATAARSPLVFERGCQVMPWFLAPAQTSGQ
jgi:2,3-bisphosphoglycerate-independent phosphoglycerate mutase